LRAIEVPKRATRQLCFDFLENENYLFLKISAKLSGKRIVIIETCIECQKIRHKNIEGIGWILRSLEWRCQNRKKPLFRATIWGEGKGSSDGKCRKFHLIDILYTHQSKELWFSEVFLEVQSLGDSQFG
jgi:hypothetical protein